jgi:peptide-methionine (S)-S-oxide reductase
MRYPIAKPLPHHFPRQRQNRSQRVQRQAAEGSLRRYQTKLFDAGRQAITTEILAAPEFYYDEDYHQQYVAKNPSGYCGLGGTGVACPAVTTEV